MTTPTLFGDAGERGADLSDDRIYRYRLWREWDASRPPFVVIGLNPSTADENADDPTIRRCIRFAKREGCGSLIMLNLFALRATDPDELLLDGGMLAQGCGAVNDAILCEVSRFAIGRGGRIVLAWGAHKAAAIGAARALYNLSGLPLHCLGRTKHGAPRHPLYLRSDEPLIEYRGGAS